MDLPEEPMKAETEMEMYVEIVIDLIHGTPPLQKFFGIMGAMALEDTNCIQPKGMFSYAFTLGFAKAMHDIQKGYINLTTIIKDIGEPNELTGPDNKRFNRH